MERAQRSPLTASRRTTCWMLPTCPLPSWARGRGRERALRCATFAATMRRFPQAGAAHFEGHTLRAKATLPARRVADTPAYARTLGAL